MLVGAVTLLAGSPHSSGPSGERRRANEIEEICDADCLTYVGGIILGADDAIRNAVETIDPKRDKLLFILETPGGYAETAARIAETLRHHYTTVEFLVPGFAISAGTILVMSGDAIHMDYYSTLGPIDPQVDADDGSMIPALGYLIRYEDLLKKAKRGILTTAEMNILLSFDQGRLYWYEQAWDLSVSLLQEWLVKYKFKNWAVTESKRKKVTSAMKRKRAKEIADKLNDVRHWNSHGRGISMERLIRELNLKIDDFGRNEKLNRAIRAYHTLLTDYMAKMRHARAVQKKGLYLPLAVYQ